MRKMYILFTFISSHL